MNGPVINAFAQALSEEFNSAAEITKYLHDLTIDNAKETELENIGLLIGYPRPLVPDGFNTDGQFTFGTPPLQTDPELGFGDVNSEVGGVLATVETNDNLYLSLGNFRNILKKVAIIKRSGITIESVCEIAAAISENFTVSWDENHDININYNQQIGYRSVWLLSNLFYRFCSQPQVIINSGVGI